MTSPADRQIREALEAADATLSMLFESARPYQIERTKETLGLVRAALSKIAEQKAASRYRAMIGNVGGAR